MNPDNANSDPLWSVVKPRNESQKSIDEMNSKMLLFHPAFSETTRQDRNLFELAQATVLGSDDQSIAELFRRVIEA